MEPEDRQLTPMEQELVNAMPTGIWAGVPADGSAARVPGEHEELGSDRTVRAEVLADLLTQTSEGSRPRAIRLFRARIVGRLKLNAAKLVCPVAFMGCDFTEPVNLLEATVPSLDLLACHLPEIILMRACVDGQLNLSETTLSNPGGIALNGDGLTVGRNMLCRGLTAKGEILLRSAHIRGQLVFDAASLSNPKGSALHANRLTVDQDLHCSGRFSALGEVNLVAAQIGGQLELNGSLKNPTGLALNGNGLNVGKSMHCYAGLDARGEVNLVNARIGGEFVLSGALVNPSRTALKADGITVEQNMFCRANLRIDGGTILTNANVKGHFVFTAAVVKDISIDLQGARIGTLLLYPSAEPGDVNLRYARLDVFGDDPSTWPIRIHLRGCAYGALDERHPVSARQRLEWLGRDPEGYSPQPYEQLIAIYRGSGREQDARKVGIAKQRARRQTLPFRSKPWSFMLDALVAYGYRTGQAGLWLLALVMAGWKTFDLAYPCYLTPSKPAAERPNFNAFLYTLDLLLPIGDLNYQNSWIPQDWARWCWLAWILAGWALTIAVVAALSGILKRD